MDNFKNYINDLNISVKNKNLLLEVFENNIQDGYCLNSERMQILKSSLQFLGNSYLRTEELASDTVDCSTLTSQAYWEGAQIGIPFIAESQRSAPSGEEVTLENTQPADIVIKFPNLDTSPDKIYNHVGLILGTAKDGITYVIESNSKDGCVISTLDDFDPQGGFKSYIKNIDIKTTETLHEQFSVLSKKVPKLSRLGAKQYQKNSTDRIAHKGIDIYVDEGTTVYAPISGYLTIETLIDEQEPCVVIKSDYGLTCVLGNVEVSSELVNQHIKADNPLGKVQLPKTDTHMNYPELGGKTSHIHFQMHGSVTTNYILHKIKIGDKDYYNGVYMAKLGLAKLPVRP